MTDGGGRLRAALRGVFLWGGLLSVGLLGGCREDKPEGAAPSEEKVVTVVRVEAASPEEPGGEYCDRAGKNCIPLAPKQKLKPEGVVRTFTGGRVTLDFGQGRRVDLDAQSETVLEAEWVKLSRGQFSLETAPWNQGEAQKPLTFVAGGKKLTSAPELPTRTAVAVDEKDTVITVQQGGLLGLDVPGWDKPSRQAGQTVRFTDGKHFRTTEGGQELPLLAAIAPRTHDFGDLIKEGEARPMRGLGVMTARLPNTDQVRDGVTLKKHHVRVLIRGGFARTEIEEEFENSTSHVLEGRYRFAVPGDASLSRLALWVGEQLIEGEVLPRERAASIYSSIVDRPVPRDPALLEWVSGGEMSLKVFPILPKKTRRVVLAYNQALSTEHGLLRYVYPLSLGGGRQTSIAELSINVSVGDSRAEIQNLRSPNYEAKWGQEGDYQTATVNLKDVAPEQDFVLLASRKADATAQLSAYVPAWGEPAASPASTAPVVSTAQREASPAQVAGTFALRLSADLPPDYPRSEGRVEHRAILVDVSQSQSEESLRAEGALAYGILRSMNPDESYVLLACDSACRRFPSSGPTPVRDGGLEKAREFLLSLRPGGSSDLAGALLAASRELQPLPSTAEIAKKVILLSDGQASAGELSVERISARVRAPLAQAGAELHVIGAGRVVDEGMLRGLAATLGGTFDLLRSGTTLQARILELSYALRLPVIRNASLTLPGSLRMHEGEKLPALRLGQEVMVTGEILRLEPGDAVLSGELLGKPYRLSKPVSLSPEGNSQNPLVPRLWAKEKIRHLLLSEQTPAVKKEITALSIAHRTMSPYTSFLVLESEEMYRDFKVDRTTRSEQDQPEALFEQMRGRAPSQTADSGPLQEEESRRASTFDDLSRAKEEEKSSASEGSASRGSSSHGSAAPAPASVTRPRPASKPSGASKKTSSPGDWNDFELGSGQGSDSNQGGDSFSQEPRPSIVPIPAPRARLTFAQAGEEWRTWGEKNLQELAERLKEDRESRARHEAYIRGHLQHGRFDVARQGASEFVRLDPDSASARQLLAFSAVVSGDLELARQMLDVAVEASPRDAAAHLESARAFEVAGDWIRACAHYRSIAEISPALEQASIRAEACFSQLLMTGSVAPIKGEEGTPGQLQVDVQCDTGLTAQDCPMPVVIAPDGQVLSPVTPGTGRSSRSRVTFVRLRSGDYTVLLLGGAPEAKGKVILTGRFENQAYRFSRGGFHTVARAKVQFW